VSTRVLPLPALALTYDRLALIEQAIQLTPSYAASYSRKNKKDQGSFRYRALNFIADVKRQLINEADDRLVWITHHQNMINTVCQYFQ
jgi:hypothetical protein